MWIECSRDVLGPLDTQHQFFNHFYPNCLSVGARGMVRFPGADVLGLIRSFILSSASFMRSAVPDLGVYMARAAMSSVALAVSQGKDLKGI